MVSKRAAEEAVPELERTVFEIAADRAAAGITVEDEEEKRAGELDCIRSDLLSDKNCFVEENEREMDYLLPFLLAAKCADPNNPTEREARRADRDCRAAFKDRLLERVAIIQRRLDDENEKLLRRQQAFSRNRDHGEGAEEEFERWEIGLRLLHSIQRNDVLFRAGIAQMRRSGSVSWSSAWSVRRHWLPASTRSWKRVSPLTHVWRSSTTHSLPPNPNTRTILPARHDEC
jgi:hypothetical protein